MRDPGPNPVELLTAILAATGAAAPAGVSGSAINPTLWPALFFWKGDPQHHMLETGTNSFSIGIEEDEGHALSGFRNIRMTTDDSSPATNDRVELKKHLFLPVTNLVRLQFAFAFPFSNTGRSYEFQMEHYDGSNRYTAWWRLMCADAATTYVQYKNSASVWTSVNTWKWLTGGLYWNYVDITIDVANHTQYAFIVNHQSTDLAKEPFYSAANVEIPRLELCFRLIITTAQTHTMYLDHILVTAPAVEAS